MPINATSKIRFALLIATFTMTVRGHNLAIAVTPNAIRSGIPGCASNYSVDVTMTIGARWEMCWERDAKKGMALKQITFTPKNGTRTLILESASLAQIFISYDDNGTKQHVVTDKGLALSALNATECPNGTRRQDANGNAVVCQIVRPRGYAWRGTKHFDNHVQGQSLVLYATSHVGSDTFVHQWRFDDDGSIYPQLGVTGKLSATQTSNATTGWALGASNTRFQTNRFISAYWRLNFDIGTSANNVFEEFNYSGVSLTRTQTLTPFFIESETTISPSTMRFWRVKNSALNNANGHNISYQIVPNHTAMHRSSESFTRSDVYVTNNRSCEQFVSRNPTTPICGETIVDFLNAESLSDVVVWLGTTTHHVARDEDEPHIRTRWQGFSLLPRDLVASSPLQ